MINNLKFFRELRGFTQADVGEFVEISRNSISSIERNEFMPNLRNSMLLARSLYVPVTSLFDFSDEMKIYHEVIKFPDIDDICLDDILRSIK